MQNESCPISLESVNNSILRIVSLTNLVMVGIFLMGGGIGWVLYVIADNLLRLAGYKAYSPLYNIAAWANATLSITPEPYDIGPKKFALTIGTLMLASIVVFWWLDMFVVYITLSLIMAFLLLLDGGFNYCVGCKMYSIFRRFF